MNENNMLSTYRVLYPDGIHRDITLTEDNWQVIFKEADQYPLVFDRVLQAAIDLAIERPDLGYEADIAKMTKLMIRIYYLEAEGYQKYANDFC